MAIIKYVEREASIKMSKANTLGSQRDLGEEVLRDGCFAEWMTLN